MLLLLFPSQAFASCVPYLAGKEIVRKADLIFKGKAISTEIVETDRGFDRLHKSRFQVLEFYKGEGTDIVEIHYRHDEILPTVYPPTIGKEYLVFTTKDKKGDYVFTSCVKDKLDLEHIKNLWPNRTTLDTLEFMEAKYPAFRDEGFHEMVAKRKSNRNFIEKIEYYFLK